MRDDRPMSATGPFRWIRPSRCASGTPEETAVKVFREAFSAARAGELERAEALAREAAEVRPGFVDAHMLLARIAHRCGE